MRRILLGVLGIYVLVALGCEAKPAALVNGQKIKETSLQFEIQKRMKQHSIPGVTVNPATIRNAVLQQMITSVLLVQGAEEKGLAVSEQEIDHAISRFRQSVGPDNFDKNLKASGLSEAEYRKIIRERLFVDKFITDMASPDDVTVAQMKEHYMKSHTPFLWPAEVEIRFIQVESQENAEALLKEMQEKDSGFDLVADRLFEQKLAVVSNYGWSRPGVFGDTINAAIEELEAGRHSGPHKGADGFYILRLKDRKVERPKKYDEAMPEIKAYLLSQKRAAAQAHWIAKKREASNIVIE